MKLAVPVSGSSVGRWLVVALMIVGAALRLRQLAWGGALWLDELALARNIADRSLGSLLTEPLAYEQVAPRGFLLLEKLSVLAFGAGEWQLRLIPLASSLVALALFPVVAARLVDGAGFPIAVALFAVNVPQVWHGAEVKPYSTDVAVAVGLTALALRWRRRRRHSDAVALAIGGFGAVWLSIPAVLVLGGLGAGLGLTAWAEKDDKAARELVPVAVAWVLGSAAGLPSVSPATNSFLREFWVAEFPPAEGSLLGFLGWLGHAWRDVFGLTLGYPLSTGYAALALVGAVTLVRRRRDALLLLAPVAVTLGAAIAGQYPFHSRVVLFLAPALICLIASATEWARTRFARSPALGAILVTAVCLPAIGTMRQLRSVSSSEEVRPVLAGVRAAWRPGDVLYVYHAAWQAVEFYGPRFGFTRADVRLGGCHRGDIGRYAAELERLRGRSRVWVLFVHASSSERAELLDHLDQIGVRSDSVVGEHGTPRLGPPSAYLYDLAAPVEPAGANPAIEGEGGTGEPVDPTCGHGPTTPQPTPGIDPYW